MSAIPKENMSMGILTSLLDEAIQEGKLSDFVAALMTIVAGKPEPTFARLTPEEHELSLIAAGFTKKVDRDGTVSFFRDHDTKAK